MTKYLLLLLTFGLLFTTRSFSQSNTPPVKTKGSVKGVLIDTSAGKNPLSNATVGVLADGADSTTEQFVITDKKGFFWVRGLKPARYHLLITYEGYQPVSRTFTVANTGDSTMDINLSTLFITLSDNMLEAVVIQRPPMGVKKDTVEYNASMFAVKPNAVAEDLLRKFPGIQVDKSGNITAQGETVTRVMVDGKRFFGDDPKLATRNLPPDIIDKIQVFDDLSDQSKFSGFDDGNRVKTINIVTKKG
ncbi:MAG: carboxypeptidase regulatory-like domain-containing protein, partial [Bacteroidetes bacterium]|nr:carboxypeptidase regulatory-like domain-containing protein [Bacteroidota bacterium]